ncbi:MAG TPA: O-methyltransferase [Candidatus Eisenbacteria bacterium]|nr:O-methyltransferase [Candidatus Eisenbacteria bacterium]
MSQDQWTAVDRYFTEQLHLSDAALEAVMQANSAAALPAIDVAPNQGKLLHLLVRLTHTRKILEIGTLGGYSTIWLARALPPGGRLISLEFSPRHADIARSNIQRAGLSDRVEIRVGPALESLPVVEKEGLGPFDFIFIDADKPNNPGYLEWAINLSRPGALIIVDNVVRDGAIVDASSTDPTIQGTRRMFEMMSLDSRLSSTALQTVGSKGYDGFAMAMVTDQQK